MNMCRCDVMERRGTKGGRRRGRKMRAEIRVNTIYFNTLFLFSHRCDRCSVIHRYTHPDADRHRHNLAKLKHGLVCRTHDGRHRKKSHGIIHSLVSHAEIRLQWNTISARGSVCVWRERERERDTRAASTQRFTDFYDSIRTFNLNSDLTRSISIEWRT